MGAHKLEGMRPAPPEVSVRAVAVARRLLSPIEAFLNVEAASGVILLAMTAAALAIASSAWADRYEAALATPLGLTFGPLHVQEPVRFWINDGLMTVFFFVVGLEIRREMHEGELSRLRAAGLPLAAALGGMLAPALVYLAFTATAPFDRRGWGIPMATDIAFALGALSLLGRRVPPQLRMLLLAIAIIDDVGGIVVIAAFYSGPLRLEGFALAFAAAGAILVMQRLGARRALVYLLPGAALWLGVLGSGIHPAIAGVGLGLLTPARAWLGPDGLVDATRATLERVERELATGTVGQVQAETLAREATQLERIRREALAPATRLQLLLHPWVAFVVMPLFALANAGIALRWTDLPFSRLSLGILAGLVIGKPAGILLGCFFARRVLRLPSPRGLGFRHFFTLGLVAGIGFTMALFIAALAYPDGSKLAEAKVAVLLASVVAISLAVGFGRWLLPVPAVTLPLAPPR